MSSVMPDDDKGKPKGPDFADLARQRFEQAQREFDDAVPQEGSKPSLRVVVPLPKAEAWAAPSWLPTGEAVVLEFKRKYGEDFTVTEGQERHWDGRHWSEDHCALLECKVAELCREIGAVKKKTVRKELESARFIGGVARRLRAELAVPIEHLDRAAVLNTQTGTIALDSGDGWQLREHRREDWCTKITAVGPVRGPCPQWLAFLHQITDNDHELRDYLQRCAGYWATPFVSEQCFWFLYGSGGNGKGAFLRTIKRVLGSYAMSASLDLFLATKYEAHPEELAYLRGIRLVIATETEKNRSWNEAKIKALTGGDSIRARFMRQNSFEFEPQFKPVIPGNEKPPLRSVDAAMRRRLQLAPFEVEIPKAQQDDSFEMRMFNAEGPQILAWILDGFVEWRKHGLASPDKVIAASEEYFTEQDALGQWIAEDCDVGNPNFFGFSSELYRRWKIWCEAHGERYGSQRQFSIDLAKRLKQKADHKDKGNGFYGIRLKPSGDRPDDF